uniref:Putative carnitine deficiency associated protein n=1 Tax=Ornithodoros turicata TaxID=34597 RepID=A0A2R5LDU9_9ACAR
MFKRKLTALGYHNPDSFNIQSQGEFRALVSWLEDQKIRHYKIEDRDGLRQTDSSDWTQAYEAYLTDLGCPHKSSNQRAVADYLLALAVRLEYGDNVDKFKEASAEKLKEVVQSSAPTVVNENPLDNLNFESQEFKQGVKALAQYLNVAQHPDHLVTLQGICSLVRDRLSVEGQERVKEHKQATPYPLKESSLGFESGDAVLNHAAKVLRLLYVHDLRDLQTRINEAIVAVQAITANPKTDTRLGKVGR